MSENIIIESFINEDKGISKESVIEGMFWIPLRLGSINNPHPFDIWIPHVYIFLYYF